jgi:two-component system CheB/CheR fusion protein
MPVIETTDGALIQPNRVYVPPPHSVVTLNDGDIKVEARSAQSFADGFFDSSGSVFRERAIGIVLSGALTRANHSPCYGPRGREHGS